MNQGHRYQRFAGLLAGSLAGVFLALPARADAELWSSMEFRLPMQEGEGFVERTALRISSETRWRGRSGGLGQKLLRVGPRFDLTDWFFVVVQPALYMERGEAGEFLQGIRAEVEPIVEFELGDFELSSRQRFAYRWQTDEVTWYYRNMPRLEYGREGQRLLPFLWGEFLFDVRSFAIDEYRIMGGLQVKTSDSTHLDLGYLFRAREDNDGWAHDHIGAVYLVFNGWE